jgi:hypothetical protein
MKTSWRSITRSLGLLVSAAVIALSQTVFGQAFIHPGGLHTLADLERMKTNVLAGNHPWIDDWNKLISDSQAQSSYSPAAQANMGANRQRADADAHAAYLNTIRWYVSGDTNYAECAVRICDAWSAAVNQVPSGTDIPGLIGIPIFDFAMAAELLRIYPGWNPTNFVRFQNMMTTYLYPVCESFLTGHNGACISHYWANWDSCNMGAILTIGVLCDDTNKFNEAVTYFQSGAGNGAISNAVYVLHPGGLGQWQESGRDQEHAQLGVGLLGAMCEVAWNQGLDLFGYSNNRLLAGAEYVARCNLSEPVPYTSYNNCDDVKQYYISINGMGRLDDRPVWELIYNHYVVQMGLSAPNVQKIAQLMRPEHGSADHFGYGTLTFTLNAAASPYPPSPLAPTPTNFTATAGIGQVTLNWSPSSGDTAQGYRIQRSTNSAGPFTTIASWADNTFPQYTDTGVNNGTTYYYVIATINQSGTNANSAPVSAMPSAAGPLPAGWAQQDVGSVTSAGSASYANVGNNSFIVTGNGTDIGGTNDSFSFAYMSVTNDFTFTGRLLINGSIKVGLMMRETLDAGSRALVVTLGETGARETKFRTRSTTGGSMTTQTGNDYTVTPVWYRLQRTGNTFTASQSLDGVTWFAMGSSTVAMAANYFVGLAVVGSTATFDNVTMIAAGSPLPPTGLTAASGNASVTLNWNASVGTIGYNVKRATVGGGPYTIIATNLTGTNYIDSTVTNGTTYFYVVSAINAAGESGDSNEVSATPGVASAKLTGTIIGTAGSFNNLGNTISNVFDGNLNTFFDGPNSSNGSNCWVGLDLGSGAEKIITQIKYCPRSGYGNRMTNGVFQAANTANFSDAVSLFIVTTLPPNGVLTPQGISNTNSYRYLRYLSPINGWGNVAEIEFYGYAPVSTTPVQLVLTSAGNQLQFSWPSGHTGWRLETQTNSGGTGLNSNWTTVSGSTETNLLVIPISSDVDSAFFRLAYP